VQTEAQPRHEFLGSQYTVGLIGNSPGGFDVLTIVERERFDRPFPRPVVSYRVRRGPREEPYRYREAKLSGQNQRRMRDQAIKLFERLDCRDYGCVDFCADNDGEIKLLSVNPNPDWDWNSPLAASASLKGLQYVRLLHTILNIAVARVNISLCGTSDRTLSSLRALPT